MTVSTRSRGLVRPADETDLVAVRRIFGATVALGRPVAVAGIDAYARFSLEFYATHRAGHVAVHERDGLVNGYVLVATDEDAHDRWQRWAAARYVACIASQRATGRLRGAAWAFHRDRLRDGWALYNAGPRRAAPAHVHCNLLPSARAVDAGRKLVDAADTIVAEAGHDAWYAQINATLGSRANALTRLGAEIIDRAPNLTLTNLIGEPVERLTIVRRLEPDRRSLRTP